MKNIATIGDDGSLTIAPKILRDAGFAPGEQVEIAYTGENLVLLQRETGIASLPNGWDLTGAVRR